MKLTQILADYAAGLRYEDIPASAIAVQKQSLADALGCMLAATTLGSGTAAFTEYAADQCDTGRCTLLGSDKKTIPALAALANGALVHALDYEDSHERAMVHPNSASIPALMAISEYVGGISGRQFLTALVVASDICCRLDLSVKEDLLKYGWNMPPVHGSISASMGAGNLLGLTADQIKDAMALNMTQMTSSGEASNSAQSVVRTVRDGFAAQAAVNSALLAKLGVVARFEEALEGKLGYFHAYARDNYDPEVVVKDLGKVFESEEISFKPWPACRATHTTIEGLFRLIKEHDIKAEDVLDVNITMHEVGRMVFEPADVKYRPGAPSIAKFSMPFIVGAVFVDGKIDLATFEPEHLTDPAILAVADKVRGTIDETIAKVDNKKTLIEVKTTKGDYSIRSDQPLGCRENPMSEEDMLAKFDSCLSHAVKPYSEEKRRKLFDTIMRLEELEDMQELFDLL